MKKEEGIEIGDEGIAIGDEGRIAIGDEGITDEEGRRKKVQKQEMQESQQEIKESQRIKRMKKESFSFVIPSSSPIYNLLYGRK